MGYKGQVRLLKKGTPIYGSPLLPANADGFRFIDPDRFIMNAPRDKLVTITSEWVGWKNWTATSAETQFAGEFYASTWITDKFEEPSGDDEYSLGGFNGLGLLPESIRKYWWVLVILLMLILNKKKK